MISIDSDYDVIECEQDNEVLPKHNRCYAHTLQLVVKDGLNECSGHLKSVVAKCSNIACFIRKSIVASKIFEDYNRVQNSNATRWNPHFHKIESVRKAPENKLNETKLSTYKTKLLGKLYTVLEPFEKAKVLVQGAKYVTSAFSFIMLNALTMSVALSLTTLTILSAIANTIGTSSYEGQSKITKSWQISHKL